MSRRLTSWLSRQPRACDALAANLSLTQICARPSAATRKPPPMMFPGTLAELRFQNEIGSKEPTEPAPPFDPALSNTGIETCQASRPQTAAVRNQGKYLYLAGSPGGRGEQGACFRRARADLGKRDSQCPVQGLVYG